MLLIFTLSLSAFTASIARTLDRHLYKQMYYEVGSNVALKDNGTHYNSADTRTPIYSFVPTEDYLKLKGVQGATTVARHTANVLLANGKQQSAVYLGIDRLTFPQVAYWQQNFSPASLGALLNALAQYPDGVLVSRDFLDAQGLKLGDSLALSVATNTGGVGMKAVIVGIIDLFPSWYPEEGSLFVGNISYFYTRAREEYPHQVWLKTAKGTDAEDTIYAVRGYSIYLDMAADETRLVENGLNTFVEGWSSADNKIVSEQSRPERQGLFGLLSVGFLTAALLTVLGFILYALFSFRRRFIELGMLRAVGLSVSQMIGLLASELVFLVMIGLLVGTGLGYAFSRWFIPYLQVGATASSHYPPFLVQIAWSSVFQMYVLFGSLFLAALSGLAALLMRMKIFQAIKLGETT